MNITYMSINVYIFIYMSWYMYIYVCAYIYVYIYICIYQNQTRISKNGIGCVSPKTASKSNHTMICVGSIHIVRDSWLTNTQMMGSPSRSNHTMICVNASLWCGRKVKDCIITICAPPLTLCTGWICPFFSCPPMCVCIIRHIYVHAHTRMMTPKTLIISANVNAYNSWHEVCVSRTIVTNYWIQAWWPPTHS